MPQDSRITRVWFEMDNVHIDFKTIKNKDFVYHPNPELFQLNSEAPGTAIRFKPGGVLAVEVRYIHNEKINWIDLRIAGLNADVFRGVFILEVLE